MDSRNLEKEKKHLASIIKQWNESRLDLFAVSLPDNNHECHGVMRFYHKDSANGKYATKCIRVSSKSSTQEVIQMLTTKFRPDMRMLSRPVYAINEVHVDGEMRELNDEEKPLLVQLTWVKDDREGRFLLHNKCDTTTLNLADQFDENEDSSFKLTRTLTKKEKKFKRKQDKEKTGKKDLASFSVGFAGSAMKEQQEIYAVKQLYSQVPESTFTRTVSNPEAVMKKRRERRLQKTGANALKVYGDRINPEIPYKSLFLMRTDSVSTVIQDALDKYGLGKESTSNYRLIKVVLPPKSKPEDLLNGGWGMETVLSDAECPLEIEKNWQPHEGTLVFQLRRISVDPNALKRLLPQHDGNKTDNSDEKAIGKSNIHITGNNESDANDEGKKSDCEEHERGHVAGKVEFPKLLELVGTSLREHMLCADKTEIGCDGTHATYSSYIELREHDISFSQCIVTRQDGIYVVTPQSGLSLEVFVNVDPVRERSVLYHGSVLWIGRKKPLIFCKAGEKITVATLRKRIDETKPDVRFLQGEVKKKDIRMNATSHTPHFPDEMKAPNGVSLFKDGVQSLQNPINNARQASCGRHSQTMEHTAPSPKRRTLPASIQLRSGAEETFLMEVISVTGSRLHFKLSPAYTIYLSLRDIVDVCPKATLRPVLLEYLSTATDLLDQTIQLSSEVANELSFWMANASELLNFIRHDSAISPCTGDAQDALARTVQLAFRHLVQCMQRDLFQLMPGFLCESELDLPGSNLLKMEHGDEVNMYNVLHMLSSTMSLLRRCRVNAALTIQLFSQLFHFINMWLFNEVVCKPNLGLCCRLWSMKIRTRLAKVEAWAEKQGLELAADCHLARITQAMHLLQAPKQSPEDIASISGTCFKLNSLQLRALLKQYIPSEEGHEKQISNELIDKVVQVARNTADELTWSDGREVQLEEDPDLQLPFLLPEDGYSCDVVKSVPSGLTEFTRPLVSEGLCDYTVNANSSGAWTIYFDTGENSQSMGRRAVARKDRIQPEVASITFNKKGGGLGLSIVAARGARRSSLGIYIRSVVPGGAAFLDGRLQLGDQLLSVDGKSLVGLTQEEAAEMMTNTGQEVTLTVAKGAAISHGLATLLEPTPSTEQAAIVRRRPGKQRQPRPKSEGFVLQMRDREQPPQDGESLAVLKQNANAPVAHRSKLQRPLAKHLATKSSVDDLRHSESVTSDSSAPRSAMSMGNLQASPDHQKDNWELTWEARRALNTYQRDRSRSSSSALPPPQAASLTIHQAYDRRRMVQSMITGQAPKTFNSGEYTPSKGLNPTTKLDASESGQAIGNPIYAVLPSPPPSPTAISIKDEVTLVPVAAIKKPKSVPAPSKSSTLPRNSTLDIELQQRAVQKELNALRDEEIDELSAKMHSLTMLEKNRLNNLLKEREFQRRVEVENRRMLTDDIGSDEEYGVPDRPDRDRLLRLQDDNSDNVLPQQISGKFNNDGGSFELQDLVMNDHKIASDVRELESKSEKQRQNTSSEDEREEEERKLLESKLSHGKTNDYPKFGRRTLSRGEFRAPAELTTRGNYAVEASRCVSDGNLLRQCPDLRNVKCESLPVQVVLEKPTKPRSCIIGTQEKYLDPRERREATLKREQSLKRRQQETSFMTFKDRQRIFSRGMGAPVRKPAASRKLIELENSLRKSDEM